jgi:hypothetical protein
VITAILFVYGYRDQVNWSEWQFAELPRPGDLVALRLPSRELHEVIVRAVEHRPAPVIQPGEGPSVIVITDWKNMYGVDPELLD